MADQEIHGRPVQPEQVHGRPARGRSLYKGDRCTFLPLSNNTRRGPHLNTHRDETPPTRSEEEQTDVMICRPNSKEAPFIDVYLICVLCSLFFAFYAQILSFQVSSTHILIFLVSSVHT